MKEGKREGGREEGRTEGSEGGRKEQILMDEFNRT
jgi:hypothetical protein